MDIASPIVVIKEGNDTFYNETFNQMELLGISSSEIQSVNSFNDKIIECLREFKKDDFGYPPLNDNKLRENYLGVLSVYKSHKHSIKHMRKTLVEFEMVTQGLAKLVIVFEEWLKKIITYIEKAIIALNNYTERLGSTQGNIVSSYNNIEQYLGIKTVEKQKQLDLDTIEMQFESLKENDVKSVLHKLSDEKSLKREVILLTSRFRSINQKRLNGLISDENYEVRRLQIINLLFELLENLKENSH